MLSKLDEWIYNFARNNVTIMPSRFSKFLAFYYPDARVRKLYLNKQGVVMGEGTYSNLGLKVVPNHNEVCVKIGDRVSLGPNITFVCHSFANNCEQLNQIDYVKNALTKAGDIIVENEVWIGANVTILPGVRIGRCTVIGAGSVVISDVEPYSIYAGVPEKKIRDLKSGARV